MATPIDACSTFLVRHAWLTLRGVVAEALVEHDLSVAQFASLLLLDESPGMSVADVARKVSTARQSANEMLTGLEKAGLVERKPHPTDRRSQQIFLTAAGRVRLDEAIPTVQAVEARLSSGFSADELAVVSAWLRRMTEAPAAQSEELPTL
ncbi:MarR family transcriptional regulator [Dactylosporangium vinaceum]|uniref:MarR family winged helix-turn-helix transcriptional regulator n=1 Tax=Dactylosporangium vinaceum TaxID=53362 RepID=A0ABV5MNW3_9ACTN|nr:MarR family transcriptional regulator [Dactylosporangium vinaceum]UAB95708.1 MarR family transcriptional regulator [Dactylosporangium vinaceum]